MAYSEQVLHRARARLERDRQAAASADERRIAAIYQQYPRLREIDKSLQQTFA